MAFRWASWRAGAGAFVVWSGGNRHCLGACGGHPGSCLRSGYSLGNGRAREMLPAVGLSWRITGIGLDRSVLRHLADILSAASKECGGTSSESEKRVEACEQHAGWLTQQKLDARKSAGREEDDCWARRQRKQRKQKRPMCLDAHLPRQEREGLRRGAIDH